MKYLFLLLAACTVATSCKRNEPAEVHKETRTITLDTTSFDGFFAKHPKFATYRKEIGQLYARHESHCIWYDKAGRIDFAEVLYNAATQMDEEGVAAPIPYASEYEALFDNDSRKSKPTAENELLITSLYFFYTAKVYEGLDPTHSKETGWYLPRDKTSYVDYLDKLMKEPDLIRKDASKQLGQYYNLRKALQRYRDIRDKGGWPVLEMPTGKKLLKPGETDPLIAAVRKRLVFSGDLVKDSGSATFDRELEEAIQQYNQRQARDAEGLITPALLSEWSVPVEDRIRTLTVNMERCRWLAPDILDAKEVIGVNIPSFRMAYFRDGKPVFWSKVVVGKEMNKTVVFSGKISYLVFSPYWNVPTSILENEIKPGIAKDPDYLEKHNMEWNGPNVRQKPGDNNSLGLVKFMFPNTNNIYLHDTPAKSLFGRDVRALSHGCVRVEKARELAITLLKDDPKWTADRVDRAMHAGKESTYTLKRKIPVYIAYFTAWADAEGRVAFFPDVYDRDRRLAGLLYEAN